MELTKESQYIIHSIYKEYLERINNGVSKPEAKKFGSGDELYELLFSDMLYDDFLDSCQELGQKGSGYLNDRWASNSIYFIELENKTIVYFENKFKNNLSDVFESLLKLRSLLSF